MARAIAEYPTALEEAFLLPYRAPVDIRPLRERDERPIRESDFVHNVQESSRQLAASRG